MLKTADFNFNHLSPVEMANKQLKRQPVKQSLNQPAVCPGIATSYAALIILAKKREIEGVVGKHVRLGPSGMRAE